MPHFALPVRTPLSFASVRHMHTATERILYLSSHKVKYRGRPMLFDSCHLLVRAC